MPKQGKSQYTKNTFSSMHVSFAKLNEFFELESQYGAAKYETGPLGQRRIAFDIPINKRPDRSRNRTKRLYINELSDSVEIEYQWRLYRQNKNYHDAVDYVGSKVLQSSSRTDLQSRRIRPVR